jgi:hypothetical protein
MYLRMDDQRAHAAAHSAVGGQHFQPRTVREAARRLTYDPYAAGLGRQNVPRVFADAMPGDTADLAGLGEAQKLFVRLMLPVVLRANEMLALQRSMLRAAADEGALSEAMIHYDAHDFDQLDRRFDVMPPSLMIALAAAETDWGRRPFALSGNRIFPQALLSPWDLPPHAVAAAGGVRRARYANLIAPVLDATHGLNTFRGGAALRRERARQRRRRRFDGYRLALLLESCRAVPGHVATDVLYAIEGGALTRLDSARLEAPSAIFH